MTSPAFRAPLNPATLTDEPFVRFAVTDIDGVCRGKHLSGEKVASMLKGGGTIASAVFGWDIADELYDNVSFTGFHTGYPTSACSWTPAPHANCPGTTTAGSSWASM